MSTNQDAQSPTCTSENINGENTQKESSHPAIETPNTSVDLRARIQGIKGERAQEKSSVTRFITKLNKLIQDHGSRTLIKTLIAKIENQVQSADKCNRKLYELLPEEEHEHVKKWLVEVAEKADEAVAKALEHLEQREDEPPSVSGYSAQAKSNVSSTSRLSIRAAEARRKAKLAQLKTKQIEEESIRRKELERIEGEKLLKFQQAKREHDRLGREETERRRIQEAKDLAEQADLEARLIEDEVETVSSGNSGDLKKRLRDFNEDYQPPVENGNKLSTI
ncbi:eukaryotic translation initiation factor 3 subunit A-like [Dendronephthya gigantea]|uniref:eukaryotic translation initiation factor 3 subunit A-like n=1 Tax=Dendronephthya gigantea TaxID=151771 RepID=UPI00106B10C7|nr:eukaryotic translation initiation factor 3 subunit A-like [Dendronephthya gigantea]